MTADLDAVPEGVSFDHDPLWFPARVVNSVGSLTSRVTGPLPSLDFEHLKALAESRSGFTDWGVDWDREAAECLCASLEEEAALTTIGRRFARQYVLENLVMRLRLVHEYSTRPEILDRPLARPIIPINLPRSGLTLLQFLLGRVPELNSLYPHQFLDPIRAEKIADGIPMADQQTLAARRYGFVQKLLPAYKELHPMEAAEPEECNSLMARQSAALDTAAIFRIPSFAARWMTSDLGPAYRDMRAQVQLIQGHQPAQPWVLRTPTHLFALDVVFAVFPDACIVHVHRDPVATITSFCSLAATVRRSNSSRVDPAEIGPRWSEYWAEGCDRAMAERERAPGTATIIDVNYEQLIADPHAVVGRILDEVAPDATRPGRDVVQERVDAGLKGRRHKYEPEWFGIDPDALRERFSTYIDRFDVKTS